MVSTQQLKALVQTLDVAALKAQLGPFVLIQRPRRDDDGDITGTTHVVRRQDVSTHALSLIFEFDDLLIASLPPLRDQDELSVGRLPDSDLRIDDASVSKRHAVLRWDEKAKRCSIEDLGSTNGTLLNATTLIKKETVLRDGDIVSFGDAQFWYLLTETLHAKLKAPKAYGPTPTG